MYIIIAVFQLYLSSMEKVQKNSGLLYFVLCNHYNQHSVSVFILFSVKKAGKTRKKNLLFYLSPEKHCYVKEGYRQVLFFTLH